MILGDGGENWKKNILGLHRELGHGDACITRNISRAAQDTKRRPRHGVFTRELGHNGLTSVSNFITLYALSLRSPSHITIQHTYYNCSYRTLSLRSPTFSTINRRSLRSPFQSIHLHTTMHIFLLRAPTFPTYAMQTYYTVPEDRKCFVCWYMLQVPIFFCFFTCVLKVKGIFGLSIISSAMEQSI